MTTISRTTDQLAGHAICIAAGARDGLRLAQFFMRIISGAERRGGKGPAAETARARNPADAPRDNGIFLSTFVSRLARLADRLIDWSADTAIALFAPDWRRLPSPFTPGMMGEVAEAIRSNSLAANPLFNTYFYRAAIHILRRFSTPPFLILEHRVDAARRMLARADISPADGGEEARAAFLSRALIALVTAAPVARTGAVRLAAQIPADVEPNVSVYATACAALLFAEEGRPSQNLDEDQFFAVAGALIAPRLPRIAAAVKTGDEALLRRELLDIKAMY